MRDVIAASVWFNGRTTFRQERAPIRLPSEFPPMVALEDNWQDSTEVAGVILREAEVAKLSGQAGFFMRLQPEPETLAPLFWEVQATVVEEPDRIAFYRWAVAAETGHVLAEAFERKVKGQVVDAWRRVLRDDGSDV